MFVKFCNRIGWSRVQVRSKSNDVPYMPNRSNDTPLMSLCKSVSKKKRVEGIDEVLTLPFSCGLSKSVSKEKRVEVLTPHHEKRSRLLNKH
jgi:hypothetical protein